MTEASEPSYEFDFAVSFAGEDRDLAQEFADGLKAGNVRVFYDEDHLATMWGEDLVEYFDAVYRQKSRYVVMFVSSAYAAKMWTRHERRSALARALEEERPYVLPVRLDDTNLPGLRSTVGYLDARRLGVDGLVTAALAKLDGVARHVEVVVSRVPRTEVERQQLLVQRPAGWEYLFFAALLVSERDAIEPKYRDHELRYAERDGAYFSFEEAPTMMSRAADDARHLAGSLMLVMSQEAQERAFGAPGVSGDPAQIAHLANRWNAVYAGFLDWAARLRAARVPEAFERAASILATYVDGPIQQYRDFVNELVRQADGIPAAVKQGKPVQLILELSLRIPDEIVTEYRDELGRTLAEKRQ